MESLLSARWSLVRTCASTLLLLKQERCSAVKTHKNSSERVGSAMKDTAGKRKCDVLVCVGGSFSRQTSVIVQQHVSWSKLINQDSSVMQYDE